MDEEKGKLNEDGTLNLNPNSLTVLQGCKLEKAFEDAKPGEAFQFLRNESTVERIIDSLSGEAVHLPKLQIQCNGCMCIWLFCPEFDDSSGTVCVLETRIYNFLCRFQRLY